MSEASWRRKGYGYLQLARLSNSPTVVTNVLAGSALAGVLMPNRAVVLLAVAMVCYYTAGMYLNDLFDLEIDRRERPERPLPTGLISRNAALGVTVGLFSLGSLLLALVGWLPFLGGLVLVALIVIYDAWHKANPMSPVLMALTRVMVYVTAFVSFSSVFTVGLLVASGLMMAYIVGLTFIAKRGGALGRTVPALIAGIALLDAGVLAVCGAWTGVGVAVLAFGLTLFLQRYIPGS